MARTRKSYRAREKFIIAVAFVLIVAITGVFLVFDEALDGVRLKLGLTVAPSPSTETIYETHVGYDLTSLGYTDPTGATLTVNFIDVLQGDSVYVEFPDGKNMLIDAGRHDTSATTSELVEFLSEEGVSDHGIDYLVLSHSDADHVGGMNEILEAFEVRTVYMPKLVSDREAPFEPGSIGTLTYQEFCQAVSAEGATVVYSTQENEEQMSFSSANYSVTFYCAPESYYEGVTNASSAEVKNNMSSVCILEYAEKKILLTGDLHSESESEDFAWSESLLVDRIGGTELDVDIYKMGHHGSAGSSGDKLLSFFKPEVAIACVGDASVSADKNTYDHPTPAALNRLIKNGCNYLFRTDRHGNITVSVGANGGILISTEFDSPSIYA